MKREILVQLLCIVWIILMVIPSPLIISGSDYFVGYREIEIPNVPNILANIFPNAWMLSLLVVLLIFGFNYSAMIREMQINEYLRKIERQLQERLDESE